jgi:hypothetical protein
MASNLRSRLLAVLDRNLEGSFARTSSNFCACGVAVSMVNMTGFTFVLTVGSP